MIVNPNLIHKMWPCQVSVLKLTEPGRVKITVYLFKFLIYDTVLHHKNSLFHGLDILEGIT